MKKGYSKWDSEDKIRKEAKKYKTRSEFQNRSRTAYKRSKELDIYDEVCAHMPVKRRAYTEESLQEIAFQYTDTQSFREGDYNAYLAAQRLEIFEQVTAHMTRDHYRAQSYDEKQIFEIASNYASKMDFARFDHAAYRDSLRLKIHDEVCAHMSNDVYVQRKWDHESIAEEAAKYTTRSEFSMAASGAYKRAGKLKIRDKVCSHMVRRKKSSASKKNQE